MRIAIDTGGTFTDCVYVKDGALRVLKLFSTPNDPSRAVLDAVARLSTHAGAAQVEVRHGTTVGTNAMLESKGARVAFVTTAGFEDTIAIGRQTRSSLYDWFAPVPVPLVPRELRFGVPERVGPAGEMLREPTDAELKTIREQVGASGAEAIAISLLFSFANPATEQRVANALAPLGLPISVSHRILPEFREYERGATTVVNAYLAPRMETYLLRLAGNEADRPARQVRVMQSSGGIVPARLAAQEPVRTVLSGPAGGVVGAWRLAQLAGFDRILGFDMGGTSTDVFLADAASGGPRQTRESLVAGVPLSVPMLDIHTAGAGGGSLARFDRGGMLRVGPESAGADPGPICFGRGTQATVTDANLLLGRLDAASFLGGSVSLDRERTAELLETQRGPLPDAESFAAGILRVIETEMEKAIRVISVERGHDPRQFTLVAFGGGGPLHACALARALGMPRVLVPALPGALSAVGILLADTVRDYSRTVMLRAEDFASAGVELARVAGELEQQARAEAAAEALAGDAGLVIERSLDLRYSGQGYELNVPFDPEDVPESAAHFHRLHQQRYGFSDVTRRVELVNVRLRLRSVAEPYAPKPAVLRPGDGSEAFEGERPVWFEGGWRATRLYRRAALVPGDTVHGPAMVTEYTSVTLIPPAASALVDGYGNLIVTLDVTRSAA